MCLNGRVAIITFSFPPKALPRCPISRVAIISFSYLDLPHTFLKKPVTLIVTGRSILKRTYFVLTVGSVLKMAYFANLWMA